MYFDSAVFKGSGDLVSLTVLACELVFFQELNHDAQQILRAADELGKRIQYNSKVRASSLLPLGFA